MRIMELSDTVGSLQDKGGHKDGITVAMETSSIITYFDGGAIEFY